jgi:GNAT superfamily N-acetyltransferase
MIEIRACTPADAVAVTALLGELGYNISVRQAAEQVRQLSQTGSDPMLLAVADGQVLGLVASHLCRMLQYENPVMRVTVLVVDGRARRRGVGRLLMEHAERFAAGAGCEAVELTSAVGRVEAHAFYRDIGYDANSLRFRKVLTTQSRGSIAQNRSDES